MSTGGAASAAAPAAPVPPEEDDLGRQDIDEADEDQAGSAEPTAPTPSGEERAREARARRPKRRHRPESHSDTQTFQAFERAVEIWQSRAESCIPADEMGVALLDALTDGEPACTSRASDGRRSGSMTA